MVLESDTCGFKPNSLAFLFNDKGKDKLNFRLFILHKVFMRTTENNTCYFNI